MDKIGPWRSTVTLTKMLNAELRVIYQKKKIKESTRYPK